MKIYTTTGEVEGIAKDGIYQFSGIRYATSTRFSPPVPTSRNSGVTCQDDPTKPSPACPQPDDANMAHYVGSTPQSLGFDESPQRLSVTAPASVDDEKRGKKYPVIIFFHGGSYIAGAGDSPHQDPARPVKEQGVIVVNVTYRLGIYGWAPHDNLALEDMAEAIAWVRANSENFHGDSDNISLMGESAGADAIVHLLNRNFCDDQSAWVGRSNAADEAGLSEPSGGSLGASGSEPIEGSVGQGGRGASEADNAVNQSASSAKMHSASSIDEDIASIKNIILISPPLGLRTAKTDAMHRLMNHRFEQKINSTPNNGEQLSQSEMLPLQERMQQKLWTRGLTAAMPFSPRIFDHSRPQFTHYDAIARWNANILLVTCQSEAAIFVPSVKGIPTVLTRKVGDWVTKRVWHQPGTELVRNAHAAGKTAQHINIEWYAQGNPAGSCHGSSLIHIFGDKDIWKNSPWVAGEKWETVDHKGRKIRDEIGRFVSD